MITNGQGNFILQGDKWDNIGMLINKWHKKFPEESRQLKKDIADAREDYKTGRRERPMMMGILIHPRLMFFIQRFYPDFMDTKKDLRTFATKFPQFVIDEGVVNKKGER